MVPADLMCLVLERTFSDPESRKSAAQAVIKRLAYVAPATAIDLLDRLPEADEYGMQVYTPCAKSLRSQGTPHGEGSPDSPTTFSRRHFATVDDSLATGEWDSGPGRHAIKYDFGARSYARHPSRGRGAVPCRPLHDLGRAQVRPQGLGPALSAMLSAHAGRQVRATQDRAGRRDRTGQGGPALGAIRHHSRPARRAALSPLLTAARRRTARSDRSARARC
jgi:hypothetical protein